LLGKTSHGKTKLFPKANCVDVRGSTAGGVIIPHRYYIDSIEIVFSIKSEELSAIKIMCHSDPWLEKWVNRLKFSDDDKSLEKAAPKTFA
jgi:hypothetical protein